MTFKELDGRALVFTTPARPYKRCLAFQAAKAISAALADGRITPQWVAGKRFDYFSDDYRTKCEVGGLG